MKFSLLAGTTSKLLQIFIQDSSKTDGSGLTGLLYNSAGLTAYYYREGAASATAITLATMTVGTWASGGFKEIDATHMPGVYQIGVPDAVLAPGADSAVIFLRGAADMVPLPLEIDLKGVAVAAGQFVFKYGVAFSNFDFPMFDSSGNYASGLTVSAALCKDGASSFTATTNAPTEIGSSGWYRISSLTAAELTAAKVAFKATATGARPTSYTIITQP